ncbi:MAG TPA: hypothetical protein VLO29_10815, partial [Salegentibacter sp.]|nr:hypothetical protein [Salegentibacter sp.]
LSISEARILADKLVTEGLITRTVERCDITPLGLEVIENGGWVQYKQNKQEEKRKATNLQKQKEELEIDLLEYQKKNRKQEEKISTLTIENLKLQNFQMYSKIGLTLAGFILGFISYWIIS